MCGYFSWMVYGTPCHGPSLSLLRYGLSSFFLLLGPSWAQFFFIFLFLFWSCFLWACLLFHFCIAHIFDGNFGERERVMEWFGVLFCGGWKCLLSSSVEVYYFSGDVYVIMIIGIWNVSHKGLQQFDKAQWDNKLHVWKVFKFE